MARYIHFKNKKPHLWSKDPDGEIVTKKILGNNICISYLYDPLDISIISLFYRKCGVFHRDGDKPAIIYYNEDGSIETCRYYKNGKLHRDGDKPSIICYKVDGSIEEEHYFKNGIQQY